MFVQVVEFLVLAVLATAAAAAAAEPVKSGVELAAFEAGISLLAERIRLSQEAHHSNGCLAVFGSQFP